MKVKDNLKLVAIKTKNKIYISDNVEDSSYFNSRLESCLIDGDIPKNTYMKNWFEIEKMPEKIEVKVAPQRINQRYELREGFPESRMTPKIINKPYIDEDDEYYEVKGLYELKYEMTEEAYEEIDFEIVIVEETNEEFEIKQQPYNLKYNLLDKIQTYPVLLPTKPCSLSKQETFNIIRNYVKNNIDPKYAKITSDYDFCFTVKKRIHHEPVEYNVNVNLFSKRKKPKYETRYRKEREVTVFECAPKPYQNCTVVTPFYGKNAEDLQNNIDTYLKDLIIEINKPYVECKHCEGMGVVLDGQN